MELDTTNAILIGVNEGCYELLDVKELETLFSLRVSLILELFEPKLKAFEKTNEKLSKRYRTVDVKDDKGEVTGRRPKHNEIDEFKEKVQVLLDAGVKLKVPTLRMSDIHRMREEEDLPILSSTIHKIRPIIRMDMELPDADELKDTELKTMDEEKKTSKKQTRAERLKADAASED